MEKEKKLEMRFDPHTIEHLGVKMYSMLPNALAELIANAYDAEAREVHVKLRDSDEKKSISIIDDGVGMSFDEINENFLRIGRKRRDFDQGESPNGLRKVTGRKGLGKLAFFGIGNTIKVTTKKDSKCTSFIMKWDDLMQSTNANYQPKFSIRECGKDEQGTEIELSDLKRKSRLNPNDLAKGIARLFNFFNEKFKIHVSCNGGGSIEINRNMQYQNYEKQIEWNIPADIPLVEKYLKERDISGHIIATKKPLKPGERGITLFAHGRLVNMPEFFDVGESSHGYSYLTGWLDVDFIDEQNDDIVSTDRQSLNWDLPITIELRKKLQEMLRWIEKDWREKRKEERRKELEGKLHFSAQKWVDNLPPDLRPKMEKILLFFLKDAELTEKKQQEAIESLYEIVPDYPYYHWRHLHEEVKKAAFDDYIKRDYYRAVEEVIKRYETSVQKKSGESETGQKLMAAVFGMDNNKIKSLSVTDIYKKPDGNEFSNNTKINIEEGQKFMSMGVMSGVRNPLAHEEKKMLSEAGLFSENDCLDILSLLSHLFRRLTDSKKR